MNAIYDDRDDEKWGWYKIYQRVNLGQIRNICWPSSSCPITATKNKSQIFPKGQQSLFYLCFEIIKHRMPNESDWDHLVGLLTSPWAAVAFQVWGYCGQFYQSVNLCQGKNVVVWWTPLWSMRRVGWSLIEGHQTPQPCRASKLFLVNRSQFCVKPKCLILESYASHFSFCWTTLLIIILNYVCILWQWCWHCWSQWQIWLCWWLTLMMLSVAMMYDEKAVLYLNWCVHSVTASASKHWLNYPLTNTFRSMTLVMMKMKQGDVDAGNETATCDILLIYIFTGDKLWHYGANE